MTRRRTYYGRHFTNPDPANDEKSWLAECHVADTYGLPRPPFAHRRHDKGHEFRLPAYRRGAARTVDVKWTHHEHGGLMVPSWYPFKALAYALVTGEPGQFVIRGFAWRHQIKAADIVDKGFGPAHFLAQDALRPLDILMACHGIGKRTLQAA